jgi:hypothetical protein
LATQSEALTKALIGKEKEITRLEIALENASEDSKKANNRLKIKSTRLAKFENMGWFDKLKALF